MRHHRLIALALLLLTAACGRGLDDAAPGSTTSTSTSTTTTTIVVADTAADPAATTTLPPPPADPLVVWVDSERAEPLQAAADEFSATVGIEVEIVETSLDQIGAGVEEAILAGDGPDLFIGRHDWIGALAPSGAIAPVGLGARISDYLDVAGDAFTVGGEIYGVPVSVSAPALFTNPDLIVDVPVGFAQIKNDCEDLGEAIDDCLLVDSGDVTLLLPFLASQGGYIVGEDGGVVDIGDVGIDNDGSRAGAQFLRDLIRDDVIAAGTGAGGAVGAFTRGAAPFMIGLPEDARTVQLRSRPITVSALPLTGGESPTPLVPVEGFFLSGQSQSPEAAGTLLRDFIATASTAQAIADATGDLPAHAEVAGIAAAGDPAIAVFLDSAVSGRPLPPIAQLDEVLDAIQPFWAALFGADIELADLLADAGERVRTALGG